MQLLLVNVYRISAAYGYIKYLTETQFTPFWIRQCSEYIKVNIILVLNDH